MTTPLPQEIALAGELLEITSEAQLNRIMPPLLKPALAGTKRVGRAVAKAAAPLLKKAAAGAIPHIRKAAARGRPRVAGAGGAHAGADDFGFGSAVSTRDARRWGTTFQRSRPREIQIAMSIRFIRAARQAARSAAEAVLRQIRRGRPVTLEGLRRVVYRALIGAIREKAPFLLPTMAAVSTVLREMPGYTGRVLPAVRSGRIFGPTEAPATRRTSGYTGRTLPLPRSRILGAPRGTHAGY